MIRKLLQKDFVSFYNKNLENPIPETSVNVVCSLFNDDFEPVDDNGGGVAKYSNPEKWNIFVSNFESFVKSLPPRVKNNICSDICDFIVYSDTNKHFLLNELTNTNPKYVLPYENYKGQQEGKETKAANQMLQTLNYLLAVISINQLIQKFTVKRCCFFNKESYTPNQTEKEKLLNAVPAFNRITANFGVRLNRPEIDGLGFEFWSFSGNQTYLFKDKMKIFAEQLSKLSTKEAKELHEILQSNSAIS